MWDLLRSTMNNDPNFSVNIHELLKTTSRGIILVMTGLFLAWFFLDTASRPAQLILLSVPLSLFVFIIAGLSLWVLQFDRLLEAQITWQLGLLVIVALAMYMFQAPEIVFIYALLPLIAILTIGWWFAVLVELCVVSVIGLVSSQTGFPVISTTYQNVTLIGSVAAGLLGGVAISGLLTLSHWALDNFKQARDHIAEARRQREEIIQVQEDLLQANQELARLSSRLKVLNQEAEEARRVKEEFVANVSHELRTPLNMVIGFCEVIADSPRVYGSLPPALLADIAAIQRNGQHLSELVNDVLDLSQIEAGKMVLSKDWTTIQEIIRSAQEAVQSLFQVKGLMIENQLPEEPVRLFVDATRIREVLLNLLSNAGRVTVVGGVTITASVDHESVTVQVKDSGPGISIENQKKLFEPFHKLDGPLNRGNGSGLGLSISRQFIELHGGKIWVESEPGAGAAFSFSLPLEQHRPVLTESPSALRWVNPYYYVDKEFRRSKAPPPQVIPRYVVLDSGNTLQRLFSRYMENIEVIRVCDFPSAFQELSRSPCQALVINRFTCPEPQEYDRRLAELPFATPVLECWAPGAGETTRQMGALNYLTKPVKRDDLLEAVAQVGPQVRTILLVDDEPEVLQLFGRMLASSNQGYTILRAKNGLHALEILRSRRPDMMLLDLVMPEMDGFEVLREKKQDETIRDIPVIIFSSKDPSGTPVLSDSLNITYRKGMSARDLLTCIQAVSEILSPIDLHAGPARKEGSGE